MTLCDIVSGRAKGLCKNGPASEISTTGTPVPSIIIHVHVIKHVHVPSPLQDLLEALAAVLMNEAAL